MDDMTNDERAFARIVAAYDDAGPKAKYWMVTMAVVAGAVLGAGVIDMVAMEAAGVWPSVSTSTPSSSLRCLAATVPASNSVMVSAMAAPVQNLVSTPHRVRTRSREVSAVTLPGSSESEESGGPPPRLWARRSLTISWRMSLA